MSNSNELDQIPEGDSIEAAPAPRKRKPAIPASAKFAGLIAILMIGIGLTIFQGSKGVVEPSIAPRAAELDSTPGGAVQGDSAAYQQSLSDMNANRADRAAELGVTSVPTPEVVLRPVEPITEVVEIPEEETETAVAAEPSPEQPRAVERRSLPRPVEATPRPEPQRIPVAAQSSAPAATAANADNVDGQEVPENPYLASMENQMATFAEAFTPKTMTVGAGVAEIDRDAGAAAGDAGASQGDGAGSGPDETEVAELLLRPGDVLYAETLTSVNSDAKSPIMAEIVSGEYKGARLTGTFEVAESSSRMVVAFTNMTLPDDRVIAINAFAVDGATAETAVASDVERRYVSRYAPIVAAAFISGYAESASEREQTVIGTGDNTQIVSSAASAKESLYSGISNAAGAVSSDILARAPKGPKIILRDGYPLGILIVDPVEKP
ncbi:TrbI/VirB10 family protein [Paracoccus sp. ME4]|uniref:DotG/IcmE/VirB10 family protein n=1 Tax=Paracoccus sp. ME4 TaxID=3138066 RepID=UPI00398AF479